MAAPDLGEVVHRVPDGEALVEGSEDGGVDRGGAGYTAEGEARDEAAGIRGGIEQRRVDAGRRSSCLVISGGNGDAAASGSEDELVHESRLQVLREGQSRDAAG